MDAGPHDYLRDVALGTSIIAVSFAGGLGRCSRAYFMHQSMLYTVHAVQPSNVQLPQFIVVLAAKQLKYDASPVPM